jgi:hypothetical protein
MSLVRGFLIMIDAVGLFVWLQNTPFDLCDRRVQLS